MLRQVQELAESLGKEQEAQRGWNRHIHLIEGLVLGHDHHSINVGCKSSPYTREEMESYQLALFILPTSILGDV